MKKILSIFTAVLFLFSIVAMSYAQTTTTSVTVTATIPSLLQLIAKVYPVSSTGTWGSATTAMSFGTLTNILADGTTNAGLFYSPNSYVAELTAYTSGKRYKIQSTCAGLVGATTLTNGFAITLIDPDPKNTDGTPVNSTTYASLTGGASIGAVGSASKPNYTLFDSGSNGFSRTIAAYFAIPPYSTAGTLPGDLKPITVDTAGGLYQGNLVFTLTLY